MGASAVQLASGVYRFPLLGDFINAFAFLEADGSVCLVDCGLKRAPARIVRALESIGRHPGDVQRILLTHAHDDHAGGAATMVERTSAPGVVAHEQDASYLAQGVTPPTDPTAGRLFARRSGGAFAPVPVVGHLADGEVIDVAGGLRVHHTPGHTPGHVSLLHEPSGVLITGDAIFNMANRRTWPMAAFCTSVAQNQRSAAVFADLDYRVAAFTHGPEIRDRAREQVRAFLARKGAIGGA